MNYLEAGVDIEKGNHVVEFLKKRPSQSPYVKSEIGGYNSVMSIPSYEKPLIVTSTDGVGTKVKLASEMKKFDTIGQDLVAMVMNDIICSGAEPAAMLDTISFSELNSDHLLSILGGIQNACLSAGCELVGGETAQMPGMYASGDFDLTGFGIGYVEERNHITPKLVKEGDMIIGIASNGVHSNGFSLIRNIIQNSSVSLMTSCQSQCFKEFFGFREHYDDLPTGTLGDVLLKPTYLYCDVIRAVLSAFRSDVHGIAHITGGGLTENIPRVMPQHMYAEIQTNNWSWPDIFRWIEQKGDLSLDEMLRTFNCGIGMVLIVSKNNFQGIQNVIRPYFHSYVIGEIKTHHGRVVYGCS